MPTKSKQYQLLLGTFIDNEFIWHDVDSFDNLEDAYREYKKYVNSQLKYTDDELLKVWNTGRLDVELRRGNRLLNWTGIYVREVAEDEDEDEKPEDKKKQDEKSDVKDAIEVADYVSFTPEQFNEALRLAEAGMHRNKIAQQLGLTPGALNNILTRYRYRPDTIPYRPVEFEAKVRKMHEEGKTVWQISRELGITPVRIDRIINTEKFREMDRRRTQERKNDPAYQETQKRAAAKIKGEMQIARGANKQFFGNESGAQLNPKRPRINEEEQKYIIELANKGLNPAQIASKTGRARSTIQELLEANTKTDIQDIANGRVFEDERGYLVTEEELRRDYETLKRELPEETEYTFGEYIAICTGKDGTLTEVKTK